MDTRLALVFKPHRAAHQPSHRQTHTIHRTDQNLDPLVRPSIHVAVQAAYIRPVPCLAYRNVPVVPIRHKRIARRMHCICSTKCHCHQLTRRLGCQSARARRGIKATEQGMVQPELPSRLNKTLPHTSPHFVALFAVPLLSFHFISTNDSRPWRRRLLARWRRRRRRRPRTLLPSFFSLFLDPNTRRPSCSTSTPTTTTSAPTV
jgi:hypothetical protein